MTTWWSAMLLYIGLFFLSQSIDRVAKALRDIAAAIREHR